MSNSIKTKIPLLYLMIISTGWWAYYQTDSWLNDYGTANHEWLYLLDALIVLPIICFVCVKSKKEAIKKSIALMCLAILVGSYIVPEQNKQLLEYLESGRYIIIALILMIELVAIITAIFTVYIAIKHSISKKHDLDDAIKKPIQKYFGQGTFSSILSFETRMWTFALFAKHISPSSYKGEQYFTYHNKDGSKSNLLGFIFVIILELPITHVLLHFIWSPLAANIVTGLTIFTLIFFIAEYRAISRRPISILDNEVHLRYGLFQPLIVPISNISLVKENNCSVSRTKKVKRYQYSGYPNVEIQLAQPIGDVSTIFVGVDDPHAFIHAVKNQT